MKTYITLDYELFLGQKSGTPQKCLFDTMEIILHAAETNGARLTLFVDTTYLQRLRELMPEHPQLQKDYDDVAAHLRGIARRGHSLQLHIHPQWAFSHFTPGGWVIDQKHYKLSDIGLEKASELFAAGVEIIKELSGKAPVAFRAGGFSAQPTSMLTEMFSRHGIVVDSSVYPGNVYDSPQQQYDYADAPEGRAYRFGGDICVPDSEGRFVELPLSTATFSPLFYWKLALNRILKNPRYVRMGDGASVPTARTSIVSRLTKSSRGFATIDESKINYLLPAFRKALKGGASAFCIIGHPKLVTPQSAALLPKLIAKIKHDGAEFDTADSLALMQ